MSSIVPLLCVPVLVFGSLLYVKESLPHVVQEHMNKIVLGGVKVGIKCVTKIVKLKSSYVWVHRSNVPFFIRVYIDKMLKINMADLKINNGDLHESIVIEKATATHNDVTYDVTDMMGMLWACSNGEQMVFLMQKVFGYHELVFIGEEDVVTLRVRYAGHSNKEKHIPYQVFTVQYNALGLKPISFPPYPSSSSVKKGLGVTKILSASVAGKGSCLKEAKESSGLFGKFYADVVDDTIKKNTVTFINEDLTILEDLPIVVNTSKGIVNCNELSSS